jgi:hypothetical protein
VEGWFPPWCFSDEHVFAPGVVRHQLGRSIATERLEGALGDRTPGTPFHGEPIEFRPLMVTRIIGFASRRSQPVKGDFVTGAALGTWREG